MLDPKLLARMPLFAGLSSEDLAVLAQSFNHCRFAKGETVFRYRDPGDACYIIETGRVKIGVASPEGKQVTLAVLGPGDMFGELALLDGAPRSADALAIDACSTLELPRKAFLDFLYGHPAACVKLLAALGYRLRRTTEMLEDFVFLSVPTRLAKVLVDLAESQGRLTNNGIVIDMPLSQSELAAMVAATRESVNKWLGYYEERGLLRFDRGKIVILEPTGLRQHLV